MGLNTEKYTSASETVERESRVGVQCRTEQAKNVKLFNHHYTIITRVGPLHWHVSGSRWSSRRDEDRRMWRVCLGTATNEPDLIFCHKYFFFSLSRSRRFCMEKASGAQAHAVGPRIFLQRGKNTFFFRKERKEYLKTMLLLQANFLIFNFWPLCCFYIFLVARKF